jgi:hemolysin activation/secretion protein
MKIINKIPTLSIIASSMLLSSNLFGATPPSSSDILRQVEPQKLEQKESMIPQIKAPIYKAPMVSDNGIKIGVKSFKITNNSVYSEDNLVSIIKGYEGKELTFSQLNEITSIITKYYRDNGYFVARAYIPAQELTKTDAIVEISVIEGNYGNMTIKNSSIVDSSIVQNYMDELKENSVISTPSLERQILLIDDLGGVKVANAEILPGEKVGTSDFTITTESEPKYYGYVIADNYGSRYTGEYRANVAGYVNSLSGKGDVLGISTLSSNTADMKNARVNYNMPIGYSGLRFDSSLAYSTYKIGKEFKNLDINGNSTNFDMGLSYPIIKTRSHTLNTSLTYTNKIGNDEDNYQADRRKNINSLKLSLDDTLKTSLMEKNGTLQSSISITSGNTDLNNYSKSIDTINSDGSYTKVNVSVSQNQSLIQNLSLLTSFKAQTALNRNLDGTEDLSVGGAYGVRSYTDSELSGDKGYLASLELNYDLPIINGIRHTASTFIDHAKVWNNIKTVSDTDNSRELNDIGLGYNLSYKDFSLKTTYAHGFGADKTPTGDGDDTNLNRVFVQAMMRF